MLHPIHQLINLAGLHQFLDVVHGHAHQEVHDDENDAEDEQEEGYVGCYRKLREDRLLLNLSTSSPIFVLSSSASFKRNPIKASSAVITSLF